MARKKKDKSQERREALAELVTSVNSSKDSTVICLASSIVNTSDVRRPTGIMPLDLDMAGGFPTAGITVVTGDDQAGKSELIAYAMEMCQRIYGSESMILLCATEGPIDIDRLRQVGVQWALPPNVVAARNEARQRSRLPPLTQEEIGTTVGEIMHAYSSTGEGVLKTILKAVEANCFQLVILDSLSPLIPEANKDKDLTDEEKRAAHASMLTRFSNRFLEKVSPVRGPNYTSVVFTQQMRANQEKANAPSYMQGYIPSTAPTGARALKHAVKMRIKLSEGQKLKKVVRGEKKVIGKLMKWEFLKAKDGAHNHITGDVPFYFGEHGTPDGVHRLNTVVEAGLRWAVLRERDDGKSSGIYFANGDKERLADTIPDLLCSMREDPILELRIRQAILGARGLMVRYDFRP